MFNSKTNDELTSKERRKHIRRYERARRTVGKIRRIDSFFQPRGKRVKVQVEESAPVEEQSLGFVAELFRLPKALVTGKLKEEEPVEDLAEGELSLEELQTILLESGPQELGPEEEAEVARLAREFAAEVPMGLELLSGAAVLFDDRE